MTCRRLTPEEIERAGGAHPETRTRGRLGGMSVRMPDSEAAAWAADVRCMAEMPTMRQGAETAAEDRREAEAAEAAALGPMPEAEYEAALEARRQEVLAAQHDPEPDLGIA